MTNAEVSHWPAMVAPFASQDVTRRRPPERKTVVFNKNSRDNCRHDIEFGSFASELKSDQSPAATESPFQMIHARLRSARHIVRKAGTAVWLALMILPSVASSENRLAEEKSPYLLQHRDNPVDWYPWGKEAFDRARHGEQTCLCLHRVFDLPLVPRHGPRVLRESANRQAAQ